MKRLLLFTVLTLVFVPRGVHAQDEPTLLYVAYQKVGYADLAEWTRLYHEHSVPVLQELQDEGVIEGWNVWQHSTGGEYNWRFGFRTTEWSQLGTFWTAYLSRLQARSPEAFARTGAMTQAHYDEIWNITSTNIPAPAPAFTYFYDSQFQVGFDELPAWNQTWNATVTPMLNQAMADGTLGGWVIEEHNTGGRYNWKVIYLFEEWDTIDDFFETVLGQLMANEEVWSRVGRMMDAHEDLLWTVVPDPN
jgi:hypothetical protein